MRRQHESIYVEGSRRALRWFAGFVRATSLTRPTQDHLRCRSQATQSPKDIPSRHCRTPMGQLTGRRASGPETACRTCACFAADQKHVTHSQFPSTNHEAANTDKHSGARRRDRSTRRAQSPLRRHRRREMDPGRSSAGYGAEDAGQLSSLNILMHRRRNHAYSIAASTLPANHARHQKLDFSITRTLSLIVRNFSSFALKALISCTDGWSWRPHLPHYA